MVAKLSTERLLIGLLLVLTEIQTSSISCLNCLHLNKENNPDYPCPVSASQCGSCLDRFEAKDKDSCQKLVQFDQTSNVAVHNLPYNGYAVRLGQDFTFTCHMTREVDCAWLRDGYHVDVNGRYSYVKEHKGRRSKDCSLHISNIQSIDLATWQCGAMAGSQDDGMLSPSVWLYEKHYLVTHPQDHTVSFGDTVTMICQMNTNVDCFWLREGHHVEIRRRYKYIDGKDGRDSSNCSIEISNVQSTDETFWQCGSMATSQNPGIVSEVVFIQKKDFVITHPQNCTVNLGDAIIMTCQINNNVDCFWMRQGHHVEISERYSYADGSAGHNSSNCSIEIRDIQSIDLTFWQCGSLATSQHPGTVSQKAWIHKNACLRCEDHKRKQPPNGNCATRIQECGGCLPNFLSDSDDKPCSEGHSNLSSVRPKILKQPVDQMIPKGSHVMLTCTFDKNVTCIWKKNGTNIRFEDRVQYISNEFREKVQDCSINITSVSSEDEGVWQCGYLAHYATPKILSREARLEIVNSDSDSEQNSITFITWAIIAVMIVLLVSVIALWIVIAAKSRENLKKPQT